MYNDVVVTIRAQTEPDSNDTAIFNNDNDNSVGMGIGEDCCYFEEPFGKWIDANAITGQYVRLYSSGSNAHDVNQYVEVEIWGAAVTDHSASDIPQEH